MPSGDPIIPISLLGKIIGNQAKNRVKNTDESLIKKWRPILAKKLKKKMKRTPDKYPLGGLLQALGPFVNALKGQNTGQNTGQNPFGEFQNLAQLFPNSPFSNAPNFANTVNNLGFTTSANQAGFDAQGNTKPADLSKVPRQARHLFRDNTELNQELSRRQGFAQGAVDPANNVTPQGLQLGQGLLDIFSLLQYQDSDDYIGNLLAGQYKHGGKIRIKPENKGKFTSYCKSKGYKGVTAKCIQQGLNSKSSTIRKRANFARNARKWKKEDGGYVQQHKSGGMIKPKYLLSYIKRYKNG